MPVVCASSLAEGKSACPNPTHRSCPTLWSGHNDPVGSHIGPDLTAAGVRRKRGEPSDQKVRSIDLEAADVDANVGSRARGWLSIRKQGQVGTDEGFRRWKELFRDVVIALVNQESWRAAGP